MSMLSSQSLTSDAQEKLRLALDYQQGGRLAEAAALLQQLVEDNPRHPGLLGRLGALRLQLGRPETALPLLARARQVDPGDAQHWILHARCLLELGHAREAKKLITEAIRKGIRHPMADELLRQARAADGRKKAEPAPPLNQALRQLDALFRAGRHADVDKFGREVLRHHPGAFQVWYLLGMAALARGSPADGVQPFERALKLNPRMAEAQFNLGFALERLGRLEAAQQAYRRALGITPQLADAHNNLGNVLLKLERHDEALASYEQAAALRPQSAEYRLNQGNALRQAGRLADAVDAYRAALSLKPALTEASLNLAFTLTLLGRDDEAVRVCERAIELQPDAYDAWLNLGHGLRRLRRHEDAVAAYRQALALRPDEAEAHKNLGVALRDIPLYDEALHALRRALELNPRLDSACNAMGGVLADMGRGDEAVAAYRQGLRIDPDGLFSMHSNLLFALNYLPDAEPAMLLDEALGYGEKAARRATPARRHANSPDPSRRLRVGLVSGDLGEHPVGFFLADVLQNLDPGEIELFVYATAERRDALNARLCRLVAHWREAGDATLDDEALANQIRADGIDILIDLAGHTAHNRLPVFAWNPAPVQATWLGYFATTGLAAIDYIIADRWVLPAREETHFTEQPWRLPDAYYCFSPPGDAVEVGALPAELGGGITFGCFNNPRKLNERVIACWSRVLDAVPDSRLFLKYKGYEDAALRQHIGALFARHRIGSDRLRFAGQSPRAEYLKAYHEVDIVLDPYPFPGGTTTVEGLWMGVPALTLRGQRFIGHQGETILHNAGLPQWIAVDEDEYVAKAAAFAGDLPALAALRAGLREQLLGSPLCDAPRFARNLEHALRGMWQAWCGQQNSSEVADRDAEGG